MRSAVKKLPSDASQEALHRPLLHIEFSLLLFVWEDRQRRESPDCLDGVEFDAIASTSHHTISSLTRLLYLHHGWRSLACCE